jgi:hypothetical protein
LILYWSLTNRNRSHANQFLFGKMVDHIVPETVLARANKHTPDDLACLTRLYFAYDDQVRNPVYSVHRMLREIAQRAGVNVKKIDAEIASVAGQRAKRNALRIAEIDKAIAKEQKATQPKPAAKPKQPAPPKGVAKPAAKPVKKGATAKTRRPLKIHRKPARTA